MLNRHDHAHEHTLDKRTRACAVEDSVHQSVQAKQAQHAQWAQQKVERESQHAQWAHEKAMREAAWKAERTPLPDSQIHLHAFNPNTADSAELVHLGFTPKMAQSVVHYREKGGRFRKKEDVQNIYHITDELYASLEPFITIPADSVKHDGEHRPYVAKRDTIIFLNNTDTAQLKKLKYISDYTAQQIIWYGEKLGGYVSVDQVREIPNLQRVDSFVVRLRVDTSKVQPLYINQLSVSQLQRHPYIRFEQAKYVREWRHRHGNITSLDTLRDMTDSGKRVFTDDELRRLEPYLSFEPSLPE